MVSPPPGAVAGAGGVAGAVLILGIDTATAQVSCAVGGHEGVLASTLSSRGKRHAESLTPAVQFTCQQARIELTEVSVVAVDLGPGLYTGLRVGVSAAKAMAHALRIPMIGVSSLDLLAFPVRFTSRLIVAAVDARRGELFYAFYRQVPGGVQRIGEHQLGTPDDLTGELLAAGEDCLLVGDGAIRYREVFDGLNKVDMVGEELAYPMASSLVMLAHAQALREQFVKPWDLLPMYLRKPDAEINWSTREGG
jgi:tRNA threonylcarbamoyladenosine biosynthesis protein TsaB